MGAVSSGAVPEVSLLPEASPLDSALTADDCHQPPDSVQRASTSLTT